MQNEEQPVLLVDDSLFVPKSGPIPAKEPSNIMSGYLEVLNRRIAVQSFQPGSNISSQDLHSLIEEASLAPSSFNLQPCRFIAVTTPELKSQLANITLPANRQKVMDASLCLLFVGDTLAHTEGRSLHGDRR